MKRNTTKRNMSSKNLKSMRKRNKNRNIICSKKKNMKNRKIVNRALTRVTQVKFNLFKKLH